MLVLVVGLTRLVWLGKYRGMLKHKQKRRRSRFLLMTRCICGWGCEWLWFIWLIDSGMCTCEVWMRFMKLDGVRQNFLANYLVDYWRIDFWNKARLWHKSAHTRTYSPAHTMHAHTHTHTHHIKMCSRLLAMSYYSLVCDLYLAD